MISVFVIYAVKRPEYLNLQSFSKTVKPLKNVPYQSNMITFIINRLLFKTGFINFWILGSINYVLIKLFWERIETEPYIMTQ